MQRCVRILSISLKKFDMTLQRMYFTCYCVNGGNKIIPALLIFFFNITEFRVFFQNSSSKILNVRAVYSFSWKWLKTKKNAVNFKIIFCVLRKQQNYHFISRLFLLKVLSFWRRQHNLKSLLLIFMSCK